MHASMPFAVDARDFAIKNSAFHLQMLSDPGGELSKTVKDISIARDQLAFAF